jgi:cysteine desulfurase
MGKAVYLDYNATAPLRPEAAEAVASALEVTGNPSSVHGYGRRARRLVEAARAEVAMLVGAGPGEIVFTSGGTEANNQALRGSGRGEVLASAVEHLSVLQACEGIRPIPVDGAGRVRLSALEALLREASGPALVSIMLANNETGVIQPVAEAAALAHRAGALASGRWWWRMASRLRPCCAVAGRSVGGGRGARTRPGSPASARRPGRPAARSLRQGPRPSCATGWSGA